MQLYISYQFVGVPTTGVAIALVVITWVDIIRVAIVCGAVAGDAF